MARFALVIGGAFSGLRDFQAQPVNIPHKNVVWLPCPHVSPPVYDPLTQAVSAPSYTVEAAQVVEGYTVRSLTAPEISLAKDGAIDAINGVYKVVMKGFLALANDIREIRVKVNALIDSTGTSATNPKFVAGDVSQVTMAQLKAWFKARL